MSNNLNRTTVTATSNALTNINNADGVLDAAITAALTVSVDATTETLTAADFRGNVFFLLAAGSPAPSGAVTWNVPAVSRGLFAVRNNCGQTVTVTISGQSVTAPTIATGTTGLFVCDGTNVYGL